MEQQTTKRRGVKIFLVVFVLLVVGLGCFEVMKRAGLISTLKLAYQLQQQKSISLEDKKILEQLGKIMTLPGDVAPTLAIINDVEALKKEQPIFFANAHNGDRLIIYPDKAIIFSPSEGKIVNVGPVQSLEK